MSEYIKITNASTSVSFISLKCWEGIAQRLESTIGVSVGRAFGGSLVICDDYQPAQ